jgi:hypothetical protein
MNLFVFDDSPWQSALWLDDIRKNKMILEAAQMLSTAIRFNDPFTGLPVYKSAYVSHPCTKWVRASRANFGWCLRWMDALGKQKGGSHKSLGLLESFRSFYDNGAFRMEDMTPFANCARNLERGVDFSHVEDVPKAYRLYMNERWKETNIPLSWRWGEKPVWYSQT